MELLNDTEITAKVAVLFDAALPEIESRSIRKWAAEQRDLWLKILVESWKRLEAKGKVLDLEGVKLRIVVEAIGL